jgi:hypothetical protein
MTMQKTIVDCARDYRLVTDGNRFRVQEKRDGDWSVVAETRWRWLAKLRLRLLRRAEARRRADASAVWESVN